MKFMHSVLEGSVRLSAFIVRDNRIRICLEIDGDVAYSVEQKTQFDDSISGLFFLDF